MRSQNRKVKDIGRASCLGLLALGMMLMNPIGGLSVFAEEGDIENTEDESVMALAETASTVSIAFLPTAASGSVTPVDSGGDKAKVDVKATVRVQNSGGYSVYLGSSSSQLKNGADTIDSVSSATTYANLPVNSWGYAFLKNGASTNDATTYSAMPATLRSMALDTNTSTSITDETRTYTLSFAANIGSDKPAGTYTNSVTMSVVSSPLVVAGEFAYEFGGITTMQAMTSAICSAAPTGGVKQLQDTRDGKYYWIGKMKDGKCWMTQNLDLDLATNKKLTADTSDVPSVGWTPGFTTATTVTSSTINYNSQTETRSWSLGNYRITDPDKVNSCGTLKNSAADCSAQFTAYNTPTTANEDVNAHYILGNHYQWNTATAGTGGTITSGQAANSICPKGWKLPTGGASGEFATLVAELGGTSTADNITGAPFYGVRGGDVSQGPTVLFGLAGGSGLYWSSVPDSSNANALDLTFSTGISPADRNARQLGFSVRCIAK